MFLEYDPDDIDVRIAELLVATSETADPMLHPKVQEVLRILREALRMDVVFVSQFVNGRRTFKVVDNGPGKTLLVPGQSDPLEESWCQYVVDGRIPEFVKDAGPLIAAGQVPRPRNRIGTHVSTPVLLRNGTVYGTLCCFSTTVKEDANLRDLRRLQITAKLLAQDLDATAAARELSLSPADPAPTGAPRERTTTWNGPPGARTSPTKAPGHRR
jgi:hypothetical protein